MAAALSPAAFAQQATPPATAVIAASAPGKGGVAGAVKVTATVVALDRGTRTATLKGAKGKIVDVVVPPEAKNFDQIRVGDLVTVEYLRALTLELKGPGSIRSGSSQAASAPAPAGAVAGGSAARQVVIMANVTAVNAKENVVTLRGPKGNSVDVTVGPVAAEAGEGGRPGRGRLHRSHGRDRGTRQEGGVEVGASARSAAATLRVNPAVCSGFIQRSTTTARCAGSIQVRCPPAPTMKALPADAPGKLRPSRFSHSSRP